MQESGQLGAHVGFSGTRRGMTDAQRGRLGELIGPYQWFHHGDCVGADSEAYDIAVTAGMWIATHPPLATTLRAFRLGHRNSEPKDYHERNRDIVDQTGHLIAAPAGMKEEFRSGTWSTIRYARRVGKPVSIIFPDGSVAK